MVSQKIKDISPKGLKAAKAVMAVLELLGLDEDDLMALKEIPTMKAEIDGLKKENESLRKAVLASQDPYREKSVSQQLTELFAGKTEEFRPDGR